MNNLYNFLSFNDHCPICRNPLTLYMQWLDSTCFVGEQIMPLCYHLKPFKCREHGLDDDEQIFITTKDKKTMTRFRSSTIAEMAKTKQLYLFFLCNKDGFTTTRSFSDTRDDYEINVYKGCYWRSTPMMEFRKQTTNHLWQPEIINPDENKLVNSEEIFSFKRRHNGEEGVYTLQMNYAEHKTSFMFYSVEDSKKDDDNYEPKIFEKVIPELSVRPDFSVDNRDKLIDRFDSWILVS